MISALAAGLLPVLCVGELLEEREKGKTEEVVKTQVVEGFKNIDKETARKVTIAYEPVWAIRTGKTATPEDADSVNAYIRKVLTEVYGSEFAQSHENTIRRICESRKYRYPDGKREYRRRIGRRSEPESRNFRKDR